MPTGKKIPDEKVKWIQKWPKSGMSIKDIAHAVGLSYPTVRYHLKLARHGQVHQPKVQ